MVADTGPRIVAVLLAGATCMVGCRAVLGIDDAPPEVAPPEIGITDSGAPEPTAPDAAAAANAYCSTLSPAAQRCADFEEGDPFTGWDNAGQVPNPGASGGGTFEELLEPDGRKLLAHTPALVAAGQRATAVLLYSLPTLAPRIAVRAKLKVVTENIPDTRQYPLIAITFGDEGAVLVYRDSEGSAIAVVPDGLAARFPSWPAGATRSVGVTIKTGVNGFAIGSVEGTWGPQLALPAHFANARTGRIIVGPSVEAPMGEATITIDDVAIYHGAD